MSDGVDEQQHLVSEHGVPIAKWIWGSISAAVVATVAWITQVLRVRGHSRAINKLLGKCAEIDKRVQSVESGMAGNHADLRAIMRQLDNIEDGIRSDRSN